MLLLSIHVDDLKIIGEKDEIKTVFALLTSSFDELKIETNNFEHLGFEAHAGTGWIQNVESRTLHLRA